MRKLQILDNGDCFRQKFKVESFHIFLSRYWIYKWINFAFSDRNTKRSILSYSRLRSVLFNCVITGYQVTELISYDISHREFGNKVETVGFLKQNLTRSLRNLKHENYQKRINFVRKSHRATKLLAVYIWTAQWVFLLKYLRQIHTMT